MAVSNNTPNRRGQPTPHTLLVKAMGDGSLRVQCRCGMVVGGRRYADVREVSLMDLLELVRLHTAQLDHGQ